MLIQTVVFVLLFSVVCLAAPEHLIDGRIMGGENAVKYQFNYLVTVMRNEGYICSGSIISRSYVLTAAHCVATIKDDGSVEVAPANLFLIKMGSNDRFSGGLFRQIDEITVHEHYGKNMNDIAVLRVDSLIMYSISIDPIFLPREDTPANVDVVIAGWGSLKNDLYFARYVQWTTLKSMSSAQCQKTTNYGGPSTLCLSHPANKGACPGDDGGPAVYNNELVGIASYLEGECGTTKPDSYTRVFYYKDWIRAHTDAY